MLETLRSAAAHDVHPRISIIHLSSPPLLNPCILNSIAAVFRHSSDDRHYCLYARASHLLETFLKNAELTAVGEESDQIFEWQRLCCEIFYWLNPMELCEIFDQIFESQRLCYLTTSYTPDVEATGIVDSLRAAICKNIQVCMKTNEEKFVSYRFGLTSEVYGLLTTTADSSSRSSRGHDQLVVNGIMYLTAEGRSSCPFFFRKREVLQKICERVVFPKVMLNEEDGEVFTTNYIEYMAGELSDDMRCVESTSMDMEWSNVDTRRASSSRDIALNYKDQVQELVSGQIQKMLSLYATNPKENWRQECSYYLATSLGADRMELVDVESFYAQNIVPELQGSDVNASPMLKAGALMFFNAYHEQIPKQA